MVEVSEVYRGKKVLVTGHTGFKGSWLSLWLTRMGAEVIGYSLEPPSDPNLFTVLHLKDKITSILGDIRDYADLNSIFVSYRPDFVFHLAAQPLVRGSYNEPYLTYETNVMGTLNVLECIRRTDSVKSCVIVTSDKCYQNNGTGKAFKENDALGGNDPYSSSKACAELIVDAYRKSFFSSDSPCAISSVRAGNVIGGGDWGEDRLVPDCIKALSEQKPVVLRNPYSVRPWQYVLEPLWGYLKLGALMYVYGRTYSGAWNFGSKSNVSVELLADFLIRKWGIGHILVDSSPKHHEDEFLFLDSSKARNLFLLQWKTVYDFAETVARTIEWYKAFYGGNVDMIALSLKEIDEYEKRVNAQKEC